MEELVGLEAGFSPWSLVFGFEGTVGVCLVLHPSNGCFTFAAELPISDFFFFKYPFLATLCSFAFPLTYL